MENHTIEVHNQNGEDQLCDIANNLGKNLTLESPSEVEVCAEDDDDDDVVYVINQDDIDEDEDGEFEFSFAGEEVKSFVSAEELFDNGKIRPTIPFLVEEAAEEENSVPAVKKVFVAAEEVAHCAWSREASSSSSMSRKSNSTGFSRLWRVKELLVRSNSDGKDTFVFLPRKGTTAAAETSEKKKENTKKKKMNLVNLTRIKVGGGKSSDEGGEAKEKEKEKEKKASMSVAYEAFYRKKKKGGEKDKSYLPYRVGFFTNANGITKNVHPY